MNIGKLRQRVTIQSRIEIDTADSFGEPSVGWSDVAECFARVETNGGKEFWRALQVQSNLTH